MPRYSMIQEHVVLPNFWTSSLQPAMPSLDFRIRIVSLEQRPELWEIFTHPDHPLVQLSKLPMEDMSGTAETKGLGNFTEFRPYIFAAVGPVGANGREEVVGCAKSVPLHWPALAKQRGRVSPSLLQGLPDGGFSTIMTLAITQCLSRRVDGGQASASQLEKRSPATPDEAAHWATALSSQPCNCVSALEVAVLPQHRGTELAVNLLRALRDTARRSGFPVMLVPLRPTWKHKFPSLSMEDYISLQLPQTPGMPYDPWLRKHVREGARVVKIAPISQVLEGPAKQWAEMAGIDLEEAHSRRVKGCDTVDCLFPGCMVPLKLDLVRGWGTYIEPNLWIYHST